mmetsp:Transcript_42861/g.52700  ORF Transcript_42861/g.52700 Transcript_42861/m.52700 type:complete len:219 (+) Transcript_42861:87-743(+)
MTVKDILILSIEEMFGIEIPTKITKETLYSTWKDDTFSLLYKESPFNTFKLIQQARFEGFIDEYFNNTNPNNIITTAIDIPDNKLDINIPDNINIPPNMFEDCCEDVCEHAICCNCYGSVTSTWSSSNNIGPSPQQALSDGLTRPICGQLSTALCCHCDSNVIDINGNLTVPLVEQELLLQRRRAKRYFILFIIFLLAFISGILCYFYYYKPLKKAIM